jgi:hypothetical protein
MKIVTFLDYCYCVRMSMNKEILHIAFLLFMCYKLLICILNLQCTTNNIKKML